MAEAAAERRYGPLLLLSSAAIIAYRLTTMRKPAEKPCETIPVIHIGSDGFAVNYLEELNVPIPTTSGTDPNDPEWAPPGGWHYLYNFNDPKEAVLAFTALSDYYVVENGVLGWNPPSGDWGWVNRYYRGRSWTRVAVCLKVKIDNVASDWSNTIYFHSIPSTDRDVGVGFHAVAGSRVKIKDWHSGGGPFDPPIYDFTPPDDWIVIVVDNTPGQTPYIRIYDRNKNVLFSLDLVAAESQEIFEDIWLESQNGWNNNIWDIKIDWIAFRY